MEKKNETSEEFVCYPVLIPTLNRYDHLKKCIDSLKINNYAKDTELVLGIDYPPNEKYFDGWKKIREYSKKIHGFKKVTIFNWEINQGPIKNGELLREYAFNNYDAYIITEDDNVFSPNFLDYMNKGLNLYKDNKNILAICGYMSPIKFETINLNETSVVYLQDFETWGYGRWKDREEELNTNMPYKYMEYICKHKKMLKRIHKHPRNLYQLLFWPLFNPHLNGKCDFALSCYCILNNKFTVNPVLSLVRNEGNDGSGVNNIKLIDERSFQVISNEECFNIKNNLNEIDNNEIRSIVDSWKNNDKMEVPIKLPWRIMTELFYLSHMILGYKVSVFFFNIMRKIYGLLKR